MGSECCKEDQAMDTDDEWQVPYRKRLQGGLPFSSMITVMGEVPRGADRFHINLKSGRDTLLHVNPRFGQGVVVRNSYINSSWGPEETAGGMPLNRGQPFGCIILAQQDKYLIAMNGQHFTEFQFRAPNNVQEIEIDGEVQLNRVEVTSNPALPMPPPPMDPNFVPSQNSQEETVIYSVPVPFKAKLGGGMRHGRTLTLSCVPKQNPQRIRIDLQKDNEGVDIALHIDIRFHVGEHRHIVCMNNFKHGHWGEEARYHQFPFAAGVGFDLSITSEAQGYLVFVNGSQFAHFEHREKNVKSVEFVHVQGDLKITRATF